MQIGVVTAIISVLMMLTAPKLYRMTLASDDDKDATPTTTA
jgi:POT family proton-dependent oligopeptide transporter